MILLFVSHLLSSITLIIGKYAMRYTSPLFLTAIRMSAAGILTLVLHAFFSQKNLRNHVCYKDFSLFALLGFFYFFCKSVFAFWGLQYIPAGRAAFLFNTGPFVSALLSYLIFKEKMTVKKWFGICIGLIGIIIVILQKDSSPTLSSFLHISWAEASILIAVLSNAIGLIIMRYFSKERGYIPFTYNGVGMLFGSALSWLFIGAQSMQGVPETIEHPYILSGLLLAIVSINIIITNLKAWLLRVYSATMVTFTSFVMPIFASTLGFVFLGEAITYHFIVALGFIVSGLYLFYQEELRQGYIR